MRFSKNGWDPNISQVTVVNNPMVINDGTHRIAIAYCSNPNFYVPVQFTVRKPWFSLDGSSYWSERGLTGEEISALTRRHNQVLRELKTRITGFIISDYLSEETRSKIREFGELHIIKRFDAEELVLHENRAYRAFAKACKKAAGISKDWTFFGLDIKCMDLRYKNYRLSSACIERLKKELKLLLNHDHYGYITSSVTEAVELECFFEEVSQRQKRLMEGNQQQQQ